MIGKIFLLQLLNLHIIFNINVSFHKLSYKTKLLEIILKVNLKVPDGWLSVWY